MADRPEFPARAPRADAPLPGGIRALVFDSDGTLVDSEGLSAEILAEVAAEHGVAVGADEMLERSRGLKFAEFQARLRADHPALEGVDIEDPFRKRSLDAFRQRLRPIAGAVELVRALPVDFCVASNGMRLKIETCLRAVGLLEAFERRIVSAYEVGAWKPDPRLIEHAAHLMQVPVADCLLVEDSVPGATAGLEAGTRVFGLAGVDYGALARHPRFTLVASMREVAERLGLA
ncbi:HAD-IA family hydrolase [Coralloluteibacterium stylophorae]|uniref:HAD-IA family hydrolase n=1 Tax=Coralloluteibacterium stylophorae TaxID=1776034 RepID=A0A8J8AZI1_9GAMM|nr:HAD-IA family hydrolase [Coralloluteibacterium stylophorae]MBS7457507.1 HAD-IA family hydrolase [Coralloluteibacterium stylophorae]